MGDDTSVRVAVRVRPLIPREVIDMCHACTSVASREPQIWVGKDKAFTFDHVFDSPTHQDRVYDTCVKGLVEGCFDGYNATVLAYGQTGSGKTYTMGTGYGLHINEHEQGIIPRAVAHLFEGIAQRQADAREKGAPVPDFKVHVQFMELYNEEIFDLLNSGKDMDDRGRKSHIKIHEDVKGEIYTVGVATKTVQNAEQVMKCLESGALSRTTASTAMNVQSSRSHAIFTLHIKQQRVVAMPPLEAAEDDDNSGELSGENGTSSMSEFETLTAKFHFVDLAGSERLKRTGATGDRAKEGISINCGLLALGNVISALGDASGKVSHVPYRDSKLTRLLQDSLGGNSRTLMIACVSPCDRDFMETLNTLRYANRAKNIKNKITVNQDKSSQTIALLRREIQDLQLELMEYKQASATGKRLVGEDGVEQVNDMFYENTMLQTENGNFRTRVKALQETVERLTVKNTELLAEQAAASWVGREGSEDVKVLIQGYLKEVEELRSKLMESEEVCTQLRKQLQRSQARASLSPTATVAVSGVYDVGAEVEEASVDDVLAEAKRDVESLRRKTKHLSRAQRDEEDGEKKSDADEDTAEANGNDESSESEAELEEDAIFNGEREKDFAARFWIPCSSLSTIRKVNKSISSLRRLVHRSNKEKTYSKDLANLTTEISCKQKLIEQLEQSQRRLHTMRMHYEEKLVQLQQRIRETEIERDRILSTMGGGGASKDSEEKVRKIKGDFERKLCQLQTELKKMQSAKREHAQLMKNQAEYERQVRKLKQEVADMKKTKVSLMTKMKEESRRHQEMEKRRNREVAHMKKESRQQENRIRSLEAQNRTKEMVLKRRHEEVAALRRQARPMSSRVAGRVAPGGRGNGKALLVSPRAAKQKWQSLEKNIDKLVLHKQSICTLERDMERWLMEREKLTRHLEKLVRKRDRARLAGKDERYVYDLEEQVEGVHANLQYVNLEIRECQANILQLEEPKEDLDLLDARGLLGGAESPQARYLFDKLLHMAINQSIQATQRQAVVQELQERLKQVEANNAMHQDLLEHSLYSMQIDMLAGGNEEAGTWADINISLSRYTAVKASPAGMLSTLYYLRSQKPDPYALGRSDPIFCFAFSPSAADTTSHGSQSSVEGVSPALLRPPSFFSSAPSLFCLFAPLHIAPYPGGHDLGLTLAPHSRSSPGILSARIPVRAKDMPQVVPVLIREHYGGSGDGPSGGPAGDRRRHDDVASRRGLPRPWTRREPDSSFERAGISQVSGRPQLLALEHAVYGSFIGQSDATLLSVLPLTTIGQCQGGYIKHCWSGESLLEYDKHRHVPPATCYESVAWTQGGGRGQSVDATPPSSPPAGRRARENVFSRLAGTGTAPLVKPDRGVISVFTGKPIFSKSSPLVCTHVAEGHSKAVLSLAVTNDVLFSSSKDRTVKIWNLHTGQEIQSLRGHPDNVVAVRYCEYTRLTFSVSTAYIKVWDVRENPAKCVHTLFSSGNCENGPVVPDSASRSLQIPQNESRINAIELNQYGTLLFSAASNIVRIWDLRRQVFYLCLSHRFACVGKLAGGHQAAVMCMAVDDAGVDSSLVVTGSKDHYIKVFEIPESGNGVLTPKMNLEPPHYDGIQSLALCNDYLFSGSRDYCIKKWDLSTQSHVMSLNQAHKDWICALNFMPNPGGPTVLLSSCRGGMLKLWNAENCSLIGELRAHTSPINAIATNSSCVFTASNNNDIKVWRTPGYYLEADSSSEDAEGNVKFASGLQT
ncbi:unnamed protein product [Ixodes hexagonus]